MKNDCHKGQYVCNELMKFLKKWKEKENGKEKNVSKNGWSFDPYVICNHFCHPSSTINPQFSIEQQNEKKIW